MNLALYQCYTSKEASVPNYRNIKNLLASVNDGFKIFQFIQNTCENNGYRYHYIIMNFKLADNIGSSIFCG